MSTQIDPYSDSWFPIKPITREKDIAKLQRLIFKQNKNVYISGSTGIGKSFLGRILQTLYPNQIIMIQMHNRLGESLADHFNFNGSMKQRLTFLFPHLIEKAKTATCIIFDDVQNLGRRPDFLRFLHDLREKMKKKNMLSLVVLISQEPADNFFKKVVNDATAESVKSRYGFEPMALSPLTPSDISNVLNQRVQARFGVSQLPESAAKAVSVVSDETYRLGSDIRIALRLLRAVNDLAENKLTRYNGTLAEEVWKDEKIRYAKEQLEIKPVHQAVLVSVLAVSKNEVSSRDAFNGYVKFVKAKGGEPLDYRQILRLFDALSSDGYITIHRADPPFSNIVSLEPSMNAQNIVEAAQEINWEERLKGARS